MIPLSAIDHPPAISPELAPPGYVACRAEEIRQTDQRVLAAADAIRRTMRRMTGKGMMPCQSIILAHAVIRAADEFDAERAKLGHSGGPGLQALPGQVEGSGAHLGKIVHPETPAAQLVFRAMDEMPDHAAEPGPTILIAYSDAQEHYWRELFAGSSVRIIRAPRMRTAS